jgi:AraC family transcriptional regulator of adaptative response / DNA-3-methyladenine glycosylase II
VEVCDEHSYARTLALPHGPGEARVWLADAPAIGDTAFMQATFVLTDVRDTSAAVERVRRLLDADCDPLAIADAFGGDAVLGAVARRNPGLRVPGQVDGAEVAVRAVVGQQVSVAGARTVLGRLAREHGELAEFLTPGLTHVFPTAQALAGLSPEVLPMPRARGRALIGLNAALAQGRVLLNRGADRGDVRRKLLDLPGIGPWTADYIALRALGDPDVFLPSDLGTRAALTRLGQDPRAAEMLSQDWRPWRSYAQVHLWQSLLDTDTSRPADERREP